LKRINGVRDDSDTVPETSRARCQARVRHAYHLLVSLPQPYDFALSAARYAVYGLDRATVWREGGIHRVFGRREVRIEAAPGGVDVTPHDESIQADVLRFLGLPFDLDGFYAWAAGDETLARLVVALAGFRPPLQPDPFEALVTSITAQQVSLQSAAAIRSRFIERWGVAHEHAHEFPTRERVAQATEDELIGVGFSTRKAEYVVGLARSDLELDALAGLPDEEVTSRLVALRGLGEWTADWFLARHLARRHAWPAGDLGLRKAVAAFYGDVPDLRVFGARFHPFENLTAHYLLTGLRVVPPA
jgi:3-methyladenine DNA glycosylase/8-oxoguanine DNA glycosylase